MSRTDVTTARPRGRQRARERAVARAQQPRRADERGRDGDRARDGERELGAADLHEPAREAGRRSALRPGTPRSRGSPRARAGAPAPRAGSRSAPSCPTGCNRAPSGTGARRRRRPTSAARGSARARRRGTRRRAGTCRLFVPRRAVARAPTSAPAPKTPAIRPNVAGPPSSVRFASSGKSTLRLNANVESTSTAKNATPRARVVDDEAQRVERAADERRAVVLQRQVQLRHVDQEQCDDLGEEGDGVDRERDPGAGERHDHAADRRADDARGRAEARVEADRVREVVRADHLEDERVPRRAADRLADALEQRERVDLPHLDPAAERERRERRGDRAAGRSPSQIATSRTG